MTTSRTSPSGTDIACSNSWASMLTCELVLLTPSSLQRQEIINRAVPLLEHEHDTLQLLWDLARHGCQYRPNRHLRRDSEELLPL